MNKLGVTVNPDAQFMLRAWKETTLVTPEKGELWF